MTAQMCFGVCSKLLFLQKSKRNKFVLLYVVQIGPVMQDDLTSAFKALSSGGINFFDTAEVSLSNLLHMHASP